MNSFNRTNIPKCLMTFCEEPYPQNLPSYMPHYEVKKYLHNIADKFQLLEYIKVSPLGFII